MTSSQNDSYEDYFFYLELLKVSVSDAESSGAQWVLFRMH